MNERVYGKSDENRDYYAEAALRHEDAEKTRSAKTMKGVATSGDLALARNDLHWQ